MSVTFAPAAGQIIGWKASCLCAEVTPVSFPDYESARAWLAAWRQSPVALEGCTDEDCVLYGPSLDAVEAEERPSLNVANGNAGALLEALGLIHDGMSTDERSDVFCGGSVPAEDFLGRVMLAQAVAPVSAEVPAHTVPAPGARFIECGRSEGYVQDRLVHLREVAEFAAARDIPVEWC